MKESSPDPPDIHGNRPGAVSKALGFLGRSSPNNQQQASLPLTEVHGITPALNNNEHGNANTNADNLPNDRDLSFHNGSSSITDEKAPLPNDGYFTAAPAQLAQASSSQDEEQGSVLDTKEEGLAAAGASKITEPSKTHTTSNDGAGNSPSDIVQGNAERPRRNFFQEVHRNARLVATHSWLNALLVFVPVGIAIAQFDSIPPEAVFAVNCVAVIPLAGLLSHATESVARKMGDALGALLNVTFGNAVELIIFIIALVKDEIRIVQASLLGSILANLLLILGMGFFLGGLRYREQIYNSTVTQMSACLLSLSVISLVLPTAFHASFKNSIKADSQSLKISRGTSVILLLVYIIYLLFQLKSHAYMYESTPQHIVDAESTPGPAAAWLDSSSSDDSSSSSSDSDDSRDTVRKRMKKVLRGGRRRKSSNASVDTADMKAARSSSFISTFDSPSEEAAPESSSARPNMTRRLSSTETNEDAVEDRKTRRHRRKYRSQQLKRKEKKRNQHDDQDGSRINTSARTAETTDTGGDGEPRRVDFAVQDDTDNVGDDEANEAGTGVAPKRPFPALRGMSIKNLAPTVFVQPPEPGVSAPSAGGPVPRVRYGIRRTNSLPDRLGEHQRQIRAPGALFPARVPSTALVGPDGVLDGIEDDEDEHLSRNAAIILLLLTTGLVAACAEFLVGSINDVVKSSDVGEMFIGLIILPIVGNAAEHVTAVTVAMKNKMDLAIGVAVGSSIQIAIFVTPLVVILGWIIDRDMTLYFTLFETVCLFVSAFMVNFLVLDGRSNYLEGALLCAVYLIIAVVAYFYPDPDEASSWGE